jgi:TIR domain
MNFVQKNLNLANYLIQVVAEDQQIIFDEGHIVRVPKNTREWLEAQKFADAIIFIGGRGGTYVTWLGALHGGMPRFPLGATSGDANIAFKQTFEYWELMPIPGINQVQFKELGRLIKSESDSTWLAEYIIKELLPRSLDAVDAIQRRNTDDAKSMFISYSHKDEEWVNRLRTLLRPAEKRGLISTWIDKDLEEGRGWESQIHRQLSNSNFALILMSGNLLKSDYVKNVELPIFIQREREESDFHLFWVLLEPCNWEYFSGLEKVQAIGGIKSSISECRTDADKQIRLIQVVEKLMQTLS